MVICAFPRTSTVEECPSTEILGYEARFPHRSRVFQGLSNVSHRAGKMAQS